jgi:hypothetical protein
MSLPSIKTVAERLGIDIGKSTPAEQKRLLLETMKIDLGDGLNYLHEKSHEEPGPDENIMWQEDPKSPLGRQLIRIHASDVFRPIAEEYIHGKRLSFINCCKGYIGTPPDDLLFQQIVSQSDKNPNYDC